MARNSKMDKASRNIQNIAKGVSDNMDTLYRSVYMSTPQQNKDLTDLAGRINSSIDSIVNRNMETVGIPSVSKLYARMSNNNSGDKFVSEMERMFNNGIVTDDLYSLLMNNSYLKELDNEIDTVCKYMPKLEEALLVQRDCVLSADHFSKDFLTFTNPGSSVDEKVFSERAKDLKRKYDLAQLSDDIYRDTSKYGEKFVYRIPFSTAISKLLDTKPDGQLIAPAGSVMESAMPKNELFLLGINESTCTITPDGTNNPILTESSSIIKTVAKERNGEKIMEQENTPLLNKNETFHIGIELCRSNIIESAVSDAQKIYKQRSEYRDSSLFNTHESAIREAKEKKDIKANGNIDLGNSLSSKIISNDGLITGKKETNNDVKAPGCIVKKLERERVVPIYIDDICMGYYYFELHSTDDSDIFMGFKNVLGDPLSNMRGNSGNVFNAVDSQRQDETIKYVAAKLSSFIDKQFVNANQDLAREIYMILKYNDLFNTPSVDLIKVTFIPPEDMVHFYFELDPHTHRGISDLDKSLIPAKIYSSLYITSAIGNLTRGQDKRVYYVKQTVDSNISQTLLNTIAQIKQSNFGIRQFQNINNILNITGRFNDYVIPTNASGDPPIQFEVMPGQNIEPPTELMTQLEEMAVNSTGIPIEIIQARQSIDYAMQLTMSSSKVLRFCYKRQELFQNKLTQLISPIYNYEYDESVVIDVTLPPPSFINITNTNQLVDNTKAFVQSIVEVELADEQDESVKTVYTRELFKHYIGTHLDIGAHKAILDRAKILAKTDANESHGTSDSDY